MDTHDDSERTAVGSHLDPQGIDRAAIYYTDAQGRKHAVASVRLNGGIVLYRGASAVYSDERGTVAREEQARYAADCDDDDPQVTVRVKHKRRSPYTRALRRVH